MNDFDLDRFSHLPRLAAGSHQPGSGKACAMNFISYINGDTKITDYPDCSARPLARLVQRVNDMLAGPDGYLSPENSVLVLDLGWQTVGTAGAPREVVWRWLSELLVAPEWGVVKFARRPDTESAVRRVAALCLRKADGERVPASEWNDARREAQEARKTAAAAYAAADAAAAAAYADAAAAAAYAAAAAADADARVALVRRAIQRWRELAGLDQPTTIDAEAVDTALARISG